MPRFWKTDGVTGVKLVVRARGHALGSLCSSCPPYPSLLCVSAVWIWRGAVTGFIWAIVRIIIGSLQLARPEIYTKCCPQVFGLETLRQGRDPSDMRRAEVELAMLVVELCTTSIGVILCRSRAALMALPVLVRRGVLERGAFRPGQGRSVDWEDWSDRSAMLGTTELLAVFCIIFPPLLPLVTSDFNLQGDGLLVAVWIFSCFGTILQLRFMAHVVWLAIVGGVYLIVTVKTFAVGGMCTPVFFELVVTFAVGAISTLVAHIRETSFR